MILPPRAQGLARLAEPRDVDVLVLGGGINGAGLLRELALNGLEVLLVDKGDFASGATSASSRMIHGGLRYLENGEFRLVRESLQERDRLLRLAPHAVRPLPTTIPIFSHWSGFSNALKRFLGLSTPPSARGAALIKIGLTLYDVLTIRRRLLPTHAFSRRKEALTLRPGLHPGIVCTATYHDAQVSLPERLCLEVIADACAASPLAFALNYCRLARADGSAVVIVDELTGIGHRVTPKVVVNATGAWIDLANASLGRPSRWIGGTKGSHLVIDHPELLRACRSEQLFYENADGRVCIFFPVNGRVLIGSTDIRIDNPDDAICDEREIDYMLESVRAVFPGIRVGREHILSRFCGVRPLPASDDGFTGRISRDHSCRFTPARAEQPWPVYSLIGGKWTTFRAFAELAGDRILRHLGRPRIASSRDRPISGEPPSAHDGEAALRAMLRHEAVVHLDDLLIRRTPLGLYTRWSETRLAAFADLAASELDWNHDRRDAEIDRTRDILARVHGVAIAP
ncbi:MAG: glycerol-3-phosphate dehydrogenase/oxidase [Verrucomicrobia bacterium]|nr:glycerol-3-phosphate dehydrogenase/oxidase [Verrucomicrobiota bacterium]